MKISGWVKLDQMLLNIKMTYGDVLKVNGKPVKGGAFNQG